MRFRTTISYRQVQHVNVLQHRAQNTYTRTRNFVTYLTITVASADKYGCFLSFCSQIETKLQAGLSAMNDMTDFYNIAQKIANLQEGEDHDLGWCRVGDNTKSSQAHGAAPWARTLDLSAPDLTTYGFKNAALAPDPEHCLMAIIKNVFYEHKFTFHLRIRAENAEGRSREEDSERKGQALLRKYKHTVPISNSPSHKLTCRSTHRHETVMMSTWTVRIGDNSYSIMRISC